MSVNLLIFSGIGSANDNFHDVRLVPWRSIGPSKIKQIMDQNGYTCKIINFCTVYTTEDLILMAEQFIDKNTILSVSTTFFSNDFNSLNAYESIKNCIEHFRSKFNNKILLGGPNPESYKKYFNADYILSGYSENTILSFINSIFNHGINKRKNELWDITTCNHKWQLDENIVTGETLPIEIGRGCIYSCKYCKFEMMGKKRGTYTRDMSMIKDEIIFNFENYKVTNYFIMDDTFNDDPVKIESWCKMLESLPFKIKYIAYCRADLLDKYQELSRRMHVSGLVGNVLGIETLNQKASTTIGKPWSYKRAKDFLPYYINDICKNNVLAQLNFIIGLPGDTIKDVWSWIDWAENNNIPTLHAQPLIIRPKDLFLNESVYSDFDKNALTKYGYRIPNKNRPQMWENENMTYFEARREYRNIFKYISSNFKPLAWYGFSTLSLGYTIDDLLNISHNKLFSNDTYLEKANNFFNTYKTNIIKNLK